LIVFLEFLNKVGFVKKVMESMPPPSLAEFDRSGANLQRILDFGGGGGGVGWPGDLNHFNTRLN
jgi:hypothetical protein